MYVFGTFVGLTWNAPHSLDHLDWDSFQMVFTPKTGPVGLTS